MPAVRDVGLDDIRVACGQEQDREGLRAGAQRPAQLEPAFGLVLRPEIAALSMSGSSFLVAINAVVNALKAYGVTHVDMPLKSEKLWRLIQGAPGTR